MKPKEKARELFENFVTGTNERCIIIAKKHALILVDEIIKDRERLSDALFYNGNYWKEVKEEIEKL